MSKIHRVTMLAIALLMGAFAFGQAPPPTPTVKNGAVNGVAVEDDPDVRRVYIPIAELETLLQHDQRAVLLPRDEFARLYNAAKRNREQTPDAPAAVVVSSATYAARIADEQLLLSAQIEFTQFADGWQMVPLPLAGLSVEKATLDGEPARLGRHGKENALTLFNDSAGRHALSLELSTPLAAVGSDKVAAFGLVPVPAAVLTVAVPAGKHLLAGGLELERPAPVEQPAEYTLPVGGQRNVQLQFTDRQSARATDRLLFATTAFGLNVAPGEVTWQAVTSLSVFGTTLDRLAFTVPRTLEIADVESTGLEAWELADDPNDDGVTVITLNYRQPFEGSRSVTLQGVMTTDADKPWSVPTLTLSNATSHVGGLVVRYPAGVRLRTQEAEGVRFATGKQDSADGSPAADAHSLSFEIWREDFALTFVTQPKAGELMAGLTTVVAVTESGLDVQTVAGVQTFFAPLFHLDVLLPAEWTVTSVGVQRGVQSPESTVESQNSSTVDSRREHDWQVLAAEAGVNLVRIRIEPALAPGESAQVTLAAHREMEGWPVEEEPVEFTLPEVRLPQAAVLEGTYAVRADDDLDVVPVEVAGLDPANLEAAGTRLGFTYQDTRFSGSLRVLRKPARVAARTLSFTRLEKETLHSHLEAWLEIEGGGLRTLEVSLSESAGTDLRFIALGGVSPLATHHSPLFPISIVEQTAAEAADGRRLWKLTFDRRVKGQLLLMVGVSSPRGEGERFSPHEIAIVGAERQNGYVALEGAGDQKLAMTAVDREGQPLAEADPADVPPALYVPRERIVAVYRYVRPGYGVSFSSEQYARLPVPTAVCQSSVIESVLGQTGEMQHRATFAFKAVGAQGLRVRLNSSSPAAPSSRAADAAHLWSALIDGRPVEVRRAEGAYLVPVGSAPIHRGNAPLKGGTTSGADPVAMRTLELFYETRVPALGTTGRLQPRAPELAVVDGAGDVQPMKILEQQWRLYYPQETLLTASRGPFTPAGDLDRGSILGRLQQGLRIGSPKELLWSAVFVAIAAGVIAMFTLGFRRSRWGGLFAVAGVLATIGITSLVIYGLARQERSNAEYYAEASRSKTSVTSAPSGGSGAAEEMDRIGIDFDFNVVAESDSPQERERLLAIKKIIGDKVIGHEFEQPAERQPMAGEEAKPGSPAQIRFRKMRAGEFLKTQTSVQTEHEPFEENLALKMRQEQQIHGDEGERAHVGDLDEFGKTKSFLRGGGLLSLVMELGVQERSSMHEFRYVGTATAGEGIGLNVAYENRTAGNGLRLVVVAGVMLLFWMLRRRSAALRGPLGAAGLAVPLALVTIAPPSWQIGIDGVFFGAAGGIALWGMCAAANAVSRCCPRIGAALGHNAAQAVLLLVGLFAGVSTSEALGQDAAKTQAAGSAAEGEAASADRGVRSAERGTEDVETGSQSSEFRVPSSAFLSTSVIVPYDPAEGPAAAERVFLPYEEFIKLWNEAHPERKLKQPAPVEGVVAEALYAAALRPTAAGGLKPAAPTEAGRKATVNVTGRLVLYSFRKHQVELPLPLGKVALRSARLDGKPAPLAARDEGARTSVLLESPGVHVLDVTFDVPAELTGPAGEFTLPLLAVPAGTLSFALPAAGLQVRVNGSTGLFRLRRSAAGAEEQAGTVEVPVDGGGNVTVSWRPQQQQAALDAIIHADSSTAVVFEDAGVRLSSAWTLRVPRGSFGEATFALPEALQLQRIVGADVGGWEMAVADGVRTVRVFFRRAIENETSLTFELYVDRRVADATPIEISDFGPQGVTRDIGRLGVFAGGQFSVRAGENAGLTQIDANQFKLPESATKARGSQPAGTDAPPQLAYRYTARPWRLSLAAARRKPESTATARHAVIVERRKLRIATRLVLQLTEAPQGTVAVRLPAGYLPIDVTASDLSDWYVTKGEGNGAAGSVLTIELSEPRTGTVEVVLLGTVAKEPDDTPVTVRVPSPAGISRLNAQAGISLDEAYSATLESAEGWRALAPNELAEEIRGQHRGAVQFAFTSTAAEPGNVTLSVSRARPRLSADVVTMTTVTDTAVHHAAAFQWRITQAAADTFVFTTPDWLAGRLQLNGTGIRQVLSADAGEGRTRWTVTLQEPVREAYVLDGQAWLGPPADDKVAAPQIAFEQPEENGESAALETQRQFVLLINQSRGQLTLENPDAAVEVQPDALPIAGSETLVQQAMAVLQMRGGVAGPVWSVRRFVEKRGAPASVNLADLLLVVAKDGTWRGRAIYTVRNRSRQFLAVRLPTAAGGVRSAPIDRGNARINAGTTSTSPARLLSVFVHGEPSRAVEGTIDSRPVHLVALPKTSAADLSFEVTLFYEGALAALPEGFRVAAKEFDLPAPAVVSLAESAEYGIPVARTVWSVYLPKELDATVVEDAKRTNVTDTTAGAVGLYYQSAKLKEGLELLDVYSTAGSAQQKERAISNLKQLGKSLESYEQPDQRRQDVQGEQSDDFYRSNNDFQRKLGEIEKQAEADRAKASDGEQSAYRDEGGQKAQIGLNFRALAAGNSAAVELQKRESGEQSVNGTFGFTINAPVSKPTAGVASDAKKGEGKERESSGKDVAANREQLRMQNKLQLEAANEQLMQQSDKPTQPVAEPQRPADGPGQGVMPGLPLGQSSSGTAVLYGDFFDGMPKDGQSFVPMFAITIHDAEEQARVAGFGEAGGVGALGIRQTRAEWTGVGGLSLEIELPADGEPLTFAKVGGDAKLAVAVRPRRSLEVGLGLIWTLVWLAIGWGVAVGLSTGSRSWLRHLPAALVAVGLVGFFLLPVPWNWGAFVLFLAGGVGMGVRYGKPAGGVRG